MEQQQQPQGLHWSWMNILDLSRNLTKPFVEAEQERERIRLGKIQAGTQGLSALALANVLNKWQQRALQAEDISNQDPDLVAIRPIIYGTMQALGTIDIPAYAKAKGQEINDNRYRALKSKMTFSTPFTSGNSVVTRMSTSDGKHLGIMTITKTENGIRFDTQWDTSDIAQRYKGIYDVGGLPSPELMQHLKDSRNSLESMFEDASSRIQASTRQQLSTSLDKTSAEVNEEFEKTKSYFERLVNGK